MPANILHSSKPAGGPVILVSFHMIDATVGWALGEQAVLRTTDGGFQWKNVTPTNSLFTQESIAEFRAASLAWLATRQTGRASALILRTTDGGRTWQQSTLQATSLKQITFIDSQHGWILAGWGVRGGGAEAVSVFRTIDGGKTWMNLPTASAVPASTDTPPPGHLPFGGQKSGIRFLNASIGWITGTVAVPNLAWLYVTHDSGWSWHQQSLPMPPGMSSARLSIMSPMFFSATDGILPVGFSDVGMDSGIATDIYVTRDGGMTWQSTMPVSATFSMVDFLDMRHGWATDGTILYNTSDGGQHWTRLSPDTSFRQIAQLNFVSSTTGWAVSRQGPNSSILLKTVDGGQLWTPIPNAIS